MPFAVSFLVVKLEISDRGVRRSGHVQCIHLNCWFLSNHCMKPSSLMHDYFTKHRMIPRDGNNKKSVIHGKPSIEDTRWKNT